MATLSILRDTLRRTLWFAVPFLALSAVSAQATWSIVAVDARSGEVGAAAATCTVGVELILGLVPGRGVIVAQAATNFAARDKAVDMLENGATGTKVLEVIANESFNPGGIFSAPWTEQQYGVATLADGKAKAYTGNATPTWSGAVSEGSVSVQGNVLRSPEVVSAALDAYRATPGAMADRLLAALEAGAARGGDARCDAQRPALSAFVAVAKPEDTVASPSVYLVAPKAFGLLGAAWHMLVPYAPEPEASEPIATLRKMYEERPAP